METEPMPYDERDDTTGRFTPTFSDEAFLDEIGALGGEGTTAEIAELVGCEYRSAYDRLGKLADAGRINRRKVGNTMLWSLDEDTGERE